MPEMGVVEKVAVVTGASRGIGRAVARTLAGQGYALALVARSEGGLAAAAAEIEADGGRALVAPGDVSCEADVRRAVGAAMAAFGRVDVLINCAGIGVFKPLAETTTEEWDRVMAVNVRGAFMMSREVLPLMAAQKRGCIVNVSSVVGIKGYLNQGAYTASKHALMGLTKVLAGEAAPLGIRVHAICPGGVDTDLVGQARPDLKRDDLILPQEIADLVAFLVGQSGRAMVDQINVRRATSAPWFSE